MPDFYSGAHRALQDRFETRRLADTLQKNIVRSKMTDMDKRLISGSDFFFFSTIDHNGFPTVSYKGGLPGFVRIVDDDRVIFPLYDGNGMFYSAGNVGHSPKVGMLFIDLEQPRRLRLHGQAAISDDDRMMADYPEALVVVCVKIANIFTNCPRYIHKHRRLDHSAFVPRKGQETPVPEWKRVDYLQKELPSRDREKARQSGAVITEEEYRSNFWKGL